MSKLDFRVAWDYLTLRRGENSLRKINEDGRKKILGKCISFCLVESMFTSSVGRVGID